MSRRVRDARRPRMDWDSARARDRRKQGPTPDPLPVARRNYPATDKQRGYIAVLARKAGVPAPKVSTRADATTAVGLLKKLSTRST